MPKKSLSAWQGDDPASTQLLWKCRMGKCCSEPYAMSWLSCFGIVFFGIRLVILRWIDFFMPRLFALSWCCKSGVKECKSCCLLTSSMFCAFCPGGYQLDHRNLGKPCWFGPYLLRQSRRLICNISHCSPVHRIHTLLFEYTRHDKRRATEHAHRLQLPSITCKQYSGEVPSSLELRHSPQLFWSDDACEATVAFPYILQRLSF